MTGRGLRGLGQLIPYDQITPAQWYELIAIAENQPLASVQAMYGATQPGSNVTNLQAMVAAHSIPQSGYNMYQTGAIAYNPQTGHFEYGGGTVAWAQQYAPNVNLWAFPAVAPTPAQVQASYAAGQALTQTQMAAPVYSQPQDTAAVIAAYNQANPQAPASTPTVVNPTPPSQATSTGTAATSPSSAVSQANGQISAGTSTVNQGTFDLSSLLSGTDWIPGIPNVALLIGGGALLVLLIASGKGR